MLRLYKLRRPEENETRDHEQGARAPGSPRGPRRAVQRIAAVNTERKARKLFGLWSAHGYQPSAESRASQQTVKRVRLGSSEPAEGPASPWRVQQASGGSSEYAENSASQRRIERDREASSESSEGRPSQLRIERVRGGSSESAKSRANQRKVERASGESSDSTKGRAGRWMVEQVRQSLEFGRLLKCRMQLERQEN